MGLFGKLPSNGPSKESFYRDGFEAKGGGSGSQDMDGVDDTLVEIDQKLKKAATYFDIDPYEITSENYAYRPDMTFRTQDTYETKELDLTKPGVHRPAKRQGFEVRTKEVLEKADFRNPLFLANFITEAGIIIKRSQTKISAKAQRKVAREIKTARAFGLMPFTTMGQYPFIAGGNRENLDEKEDMGIHIPYRFVESNPIAVPDPVADPDPIVDPDPTADPDPMAY
ncbi:Ribosomal protein s18 [Thalictrum thalictroides]|uniref:Small ribosomal subunit protein bS18c n=1 Tax=Thalictrum thalictroides TaxID=46969 RepID=A0A7J6W8W8_THATH|nr:Ribosomal protein s18 [Thalictrum thalictroides]